MGTEERTTFEVLDLRYGKRLVINRAVNGQVWLAEDEVAALILFLQECGVTWKVSAPASAATASPS